MKKKFNNIGARLNQRFEKNVCTILAHINSKIIEPKVYLIT